MRAREFLLCLALLAGISPRALAQGLPAPAGSAAEPVLLESTVRQAIERFRAEPTSAAGRRSAAMIVKFAEKSPLVDVVIGPKSVPWLSEQVDSSLSTLLLAAFVAGNVQSQLDRRVRKDDTRAGVEQVLETYAKIRRSEPKFRVASIDKLAELKASGGLADYLAEK